MYTIKKVYAREVIETKEFWWLANIAPTVLEIMGVEKCEEMEGSLV